MIKDGHPYTTNDFGEDFSIVSDLPEEKQKEIFDTLNRWFIKSKKTSLRHTSYGMKHWLEDAINRYITNNQFKDAMLILGFEASNYEELNWCFKVKPTEELLKFLDDTRRCW